MSELVILALIAFISQLTAVFVAAGFSYIAARRLRMDLSRNTEMTRRTYEAIEAARSRPYSTQDWAAPGSN
jgi:CBS domain containing-hemolysin-like protein